MSNRITQFCMSYSELWGCKGMCSPITKNKRNLLHNWVKQSSRATADLFFQHFIEVTAIVFNSNDSECIVAFAPPVEMSHNIGDLVCHALSLSHSPLFLSPRSAAIKWAAEKKDYRIIQDAGVEDLIWGILHLLSHIAAEQGAFSFKPCCGAYQKENREREECLIILLRHKKDFGVPGSKCVSLEGLGVISVSSADAPKGSGLRR